MTSHLCLLLLPTAAGCGWKIASAGAAGDISGACGNLHRVNGRYAVVLLRLIFLSGGVVYV